MTGRGGLENPGRKGERVVVIALFFVAHWQASVFFQSFFLHRYGAHRMYSMSPRWEKFFYLCTYVVQGPSFLSPRGYGILHRMHHAFSDTPKDPHSPYNFRSVLPMMLDTKKTYDDFAYARATPEGRFDGGLPSWPAVDRLSQSWAARVAWGAAYTLFYVNFATHAWMFLLLPFHYVMGPVHGAIVNWCGHKYGYSSFDNGDRSRNSLFFDFLTAGELFQNNHHKFAMSPNFAARWFELDTTFQIMRVLAFLRIIDMTGAQVPKLAGAHRSVEPA
jgi:stearoyl-CoA desaturase (Delta-9 desaturase)